MQSQSTDWVKWGADLVAAGLGGVIGGTLVAFAKGFYQKKGEHLATYEDIETLLAIKRAEAYEEERGKRLATNEDIELVLREVRAVTKETETIKAKISDEAAARQTLRVQRGELYADIFKTIEQHITIVTKLLWEWDVKNFGDRAAEEVHQTRFKEMRNQELGMKNRLLRFRALADVFLNDEAKNAFTKYYNGEASSRNSLEARRDNLVSLQEWLAKAAKQDLDVENSLTETRQPGQNQSAIDTRQGTSV